MTNFLSHIDKGDVLSPIFNTSIDGYAFQILIQWADGTKFSGLFLKNHRRKSCDKPLKNFKIPYSLELVANDGSLKSKKSK